MSEETRQYLTEEYSDERQPGDGEFYQKIRLYQGVFGRKNRYFERRWWARLGAVSTSSNRRKQLKQLLNHEQLAPAFDALRFLPALYCGFELSTISKTIAMRFLEVGPCGTHSQVSLLINRCIGVHILSEFHENQVVFHF